MPLWTPNRSPDRYPAHWHAVLAGLPGEYLLETVKTLREVEALRYKFGAFKACVKAHPMTMGARQLKNLDTTVFFEWEGSNVVVKVRTKWSKAYLRNFADGQHEFSGE